MGKSKYKYADVQALSGELVAPEEGKPYIRVTLKVVDSKQMPHRVGEEVTELLSLSDKAAEFTFKALRALGWTCNDVTELEGLGSTMATGGFYNDTYNGNTREKVAIFEKKKPVAAVSGKAKKDFAAKFKKLAAEHGPVERGDFNKAVDREALPDAPEPSDTSDPFGAGDDGDDDFEF